MILLKSRAAAALLLSSLFFILGCAQKKAPVDPPPASPELPYLTLKFSRTDGKPISQMKITIFSGDDSHTSIWPLDTQTLAIRKIDQGEKILFAVDIGDNAEIALLTISRTWGCEEPWFHNHFKLERSSAGFWMCGPSQENDKSTMSLDRPGQVVSIAF